MRKQTLELYGTLNKKVLTCPLNFDTDVPSVCYTLCTHVTFMWVDMNVCVCVCAQRMNNRTTRQILSAPYGPDCSSNYKVVIFLV